MLTLTDEQEKLLKALLRKFPAGGDSWEQSYAKEYDAFAKSMHGCVGRWSAKKSGIDSHTITDGHTLFIITCPDPSMAYTIRELLNEYDIRCHS